MSDDYQTYDDTPGQNEKLEIDSKAVISVLQMPYNGLKTSLSVEEFYHRYTLHRLYNNNFKIYINNGVIEKI